MNIDLLSGSGHKIYAPKGTGFLYLRQGIQLKSLVHGGEQEMAHRPGTENVSGIAAFGLSSELAEAEMQAETERLTRLRDKLIRGIEGRINQVKLNGHPSDRIAGNVHFSYQAVEGEAILKALNQQGIAVSGGSACTAGSKEPSHVLAAMGLGADLAAAVRMTLGRENTEEEIEYVLEKLPAVVRDLRVNRK